LETLFQFGAIAALVVFQPELRSALAHLGQNRLLRFFNRLEETEVAEEIALAAEELSRNQVGAIIAIEREMGLGEYVETGTPLQARVSSALLNTIFSPYSPLHDGAAIVRGDTIVAAGAILPLTQFPVADKSLGTRHRAALGLSEESDAVVVVVSEETSQISVAYRGQLQRGFDRERLTDLLTTQTRRAGFR
jgi:diadenylate cyclase